MEFKHVSVLLEETLESLNIQENGIYVDCTLGGAGHSKEILKRLSSKGKLIGIDQDCDALEASKITLKEYNNVEFVHDNFHNIDNILKRLSIDKVDGILMDLGVSSYQIDKAERGFSYMRNAPLDMRMNKDSKLSAYDVVNFYEEEKIYKLLKDYGEERFSKRIASNIVKKRNEEPIKTTFDLVDIIKESIPFKFRKEGHPGKKTFQAIRIEVNGELEILNQAIEDSVNNLKKDGRLSIITFHSLEDRIVKNKFRELNDPCTCPKDFPLCICGKKPIVNLITKKPINPNEREKNENSRSRSAKLRVVEKI
ncbi:MAG: 16S rRNA (cytosine(1402)-N(4))-methyltransferase RsmH [Clostridiaceae bacterium]